METGSDRPDLKVLDFKSLGQKEQEDDEEQNKKVYNEGLLPFLNVIAGLGERDKILTLAIVMEYEPPESTEELPMKAFSAFRIVNRGKLFYRLSRCPPGEIQDRAAYRRPERVPGAV